MAGVLNSKRKKRTIAGAVTIDGLALDWILISEPQWSNSGDGYKGLCISVTKADEARRELVIEYPYPIDRDSRPLSVPQRPTVSPKLVEEDIRSALKAGWDPSSRGRAFIYNPADVCARPVAHVRRRGGTSHYRTNPPMFSQWKKGCRGQTPRGHIRLRQGRSTGLSGR